VPNTQTDRHTDHAVTCDICSNRTHLCTACMLCGPTNKTVLHTVRLFTAARTTNVDQRAVNNQTRAPAKLIAQLNTLSPTHVNIHRCIRHRDVGSIHRQVPATPLPPLPFRSSQLPGLRQQLNQRHHCSDFATGVVKNQRCADG